MKSRVEEVKRTLIRNSDEGIESRTVTNVALIEIAKSLAVIADLLAGKNKFVVLHYDGKPVCHNADKIVTLGEGKDKETGHTIIECATDSGSLYHVVDEPVEDVLEKLGVTV